MRHVKMLLAAAAMIMVSGTAMAECPSGSEGLPNSKWSWADGGSSTSSSTSFGDISYAGKSGNGWADVTTTTITTTICLAINPGGNVVDDKSTSVITTTTSVEEGVKVCENSPNGTDLAGDLCR